MNIGIVGGGKVGCCLAAYFSRLGMLSGITASTAEKSVLLAERFHTAPADNFSLLKKADVIFLTVPDRFIATVAEQLAAGSGELSGKIFFHCSGSLGLDVLDALREHGAITGSIHPLQSFITSQTELQGVYMAVDGDEQAKICAEEIISKLQGRSFFVPAEERSLYHSAACICSNYLVAVEYLAQQIMSKWTGSETDAWQALLPLFKGTVRNLEHTDNTGSVLTGPIARGDFNTLSGHLSVMPAEYVPVYCSLGLETVKIASANGTIDSETMQKMQKLLCNPEVKYDK